MKHQLLRLFQRLFRRGKPKQQLRISGPIPSAWGAERARSLIEPSPDDIYIDITEQPTLILPVVTQVLPAFAPWPIGLDECGPTEAVEIPVVYWGYDSPTVVVPRRVDRYATMPMDLADILK
jgi:hypothetical protein